MVPATTSYTVLLCWKKRSVMKTGKRKAMEKFLLSARTVDLRKRRNRKLWTDSLRLWTKSLFISWRLSRNHSRGEGDAGRGDNKNPVGSDQRGRVTCHHSQAEQELPRRGATRAPDTERLIGRKHLTVAPNVLGTGGLTGHKASAREEQPRRPGAASHRGPRQPTHHHNQGASA